MAELLWRIAWAVIGIDLLLFTGVFFLGGLINAKLHSGSIIQSWLVGVILAIIGFFLIVKAILPGKNPK